MKFLFSCSVCYLTRSLHPTRNSTHVLSLFLSGVLKAKVRPTMLGEICYVFTQNATYAFQAILSNVL